MTEQPGDVLADHLPRLPPLKPHVERTEASPYFGTDQVRNNGRKGPIVYFSCRRCVHSDSDGKPTTVKVPVGR